MVARRAAARSVLLVVLAAWHAWVVLALLPRPRALPAPVDVVSVWLPRPEPPAEEIRPRAPSTAPAPLFSPSAPSLSLPLAEAGAAPVEDAPAASPPVDWSKEASRAADAVAEALPVIPDTQSRPSKPYWTRKHERGEQVPLGDGRWLVWVNERCYTITEPFARSGDPMSVRCPRAKPPVDAEVLNKLRPRYLDVPVPGPR